MQIEQIAADAATESRAAFTADPKAFEAAAAFLAKRVMERRNSIPILSHIRIEATPAGAVILSGTDLDQLARVTIAADVESPGTICVEAGPLADALAKLRKGGAWEVRFADKGGCRAKVNASGVRAAFDLRGLPADDFPATVTPTVDEALSAFTVAAAPFLSDLAALAPCISTEETRYYLNGIAMQVRDLGGRERLAMVATDGSNIGAASRPIPAGAERLPDSIVPRKTVATIRHAAKLVPDCEAVAVEVEGNRARFALGPVVIESKLIDGTFPQWERAFEGLAPTGEGDAPLFPELVPGAPLAAMAKLEKGAGQVIEWQEAEIGRLGSVPADPGLAFGCCNVTAANEPVKGYRYSYEHDRGMAGRYLIAQAERRHGPIPFAWSKRLQVEGGEAVGLTVGETKWIPGEYVERPNWETLVVEQVYIEGRSEWIEGAYSVVMPREARRQLRADVTLEIDGDSTVYPVATNSADKIHLTADQVRNIAGDSVFETLALTIAGKVVYVLAWLFAQGDSRFLTVRSDGRCFAGKDRHKAQYLTLEQVEAALRGEEVVEAVEICPPEAAESDSGPCVVAEAPEAPEALCEAVSGQDEPVTIADKLPAPEAVKDSLTTDPVAALVARVEALEAIVATLSAETGETVDDHPVKATGVGDSEGAFRDNQATPTVAKRIVRWRKAYRPAAHLYMNAGQERRWRAEPALTYRTIERMDSMAAKPLPDQALLLKLLRYEPETGELFWRERTPDLFESGNTSKEANCRAWNRRYSGKPAFKNLDTHKYRCGRLLDRMALAHRVIWKMMTGYDAMQVDHINGVRDDNRWCNLRSVSRSDNCRNTKIYSNNKSGISGVHWNSSQRKWIARIHGKNPIYLGVFSTKDDAVRARKAAEREHGFHPNHGRNQSR